MVLQSLLNKLTYHTLYLCFYWDIFPQGRIYNSGIFGPPKIIWDILSKYVYSFFTGKRKVHSQKRMKNHCARRKNSSFNSKHPRLKELNKYFSINCFKWKNLTSFKIISYLTDKWLSCYNNHFIYFKAKIFIYSYNVSG